MLKLTVVVQGITFGFDGLTTNDALTIVDHVLAHGSPYVAPINGVRQTLKIATDDLVASLPKQP